MQGKSHKSRLYLELLAPHSCPSRHACVCWGCGRWGEGRAAAVSRNGVEILCGSRAACPPALCTTEGEHQGRCPRLTVARERGAGIPDPGDPCSALRGPLQPHRACKPWGPLLRPARSSAAPQSLQPGANIQESEDRALAACSPRAGGSFWLTGAWQVGALAWPSCFSQLLVPPRLRSLPIQRWPPCPAAWNLGQSPRCAGPPEGRGG